MQTQPTTSPAAIFLAAALAVVAFSALGVMAGLYASVFL